MAWQPDRNEYAVDVGKQRHTLPRTGARVNFLASARWTRRCGNGASWVSEPPCPSRPPVPVTTDHVDTDRLESYDFELPEHLIAASPSQTRDGSRLLHAGSTLNDLRFSQLGDLLRPGDLLVFNDARVTPARLHGVRVTGGRVEFLVVGFGAEGVWVADRQANGEWVPMLAMTRSNNPLHPGEVVRLDGGGSVELLERVDGMWLMRSQEDEAPDDLLERCGNLPLPPYILERRTALGLAVTDEDDAIRYQTVYARAAGAVAAPTAGLHFTSELLQQLADRGIEQAMLSLMVGVGTFRPVRTETLSAHAMHGEWFEIPGTTADAVRQCRARGGRVVAVGTTVVRALEASAASSPDQLPAEGRSWTDILIQPGHPWRIVDALVTNFHLPRSTLLALVAAFMGHGAMKQAYAHAVASEYRFFSYGDAMFTERQTRR